MKKTEKYKDKPEHLMISLMVDRSCGEKLAKEVVNILKQSSEKFEFVIPLSSYQFIFQNMTIIIPRTNKESRHVKILIYKYTTIEKNILVSILSIIKKYCIDDLYNEAVYQNKREFFVDANEEVSLEKSYSKSKNIFDIETTQIYNVSISRKNKKGIKYTEMIRISFKIKKGHINFLPIILPKIFAEKDILVKDVTNS